MASKTDARLSTIRDRDLVCFSRALAELTAPGLDAANYPERAFRFLARLVPNELLGLGACSPTDGGLSASFNQHLAGMETTFAAFGVLMHRHAPFRFDPALHGGRPYSMPDCYGRRRFHDLDIYQEVHRPMGFSDHGFVHVPSGDGTNVFFGLFRAGGDFTPREKELLALAQPHLANLRGLASALTAARELPLEPGLFEPLGLTPRECEVIYWLTQGKTNLEVALVLRVRADTVSSYLRAIYEKLDVENRTAATLVALERARAAWLRSRPPAEEGSGVVTFQVQTGRRER